MSNQRYGLQIRGEMVHSTGQSSQRIDYFDTLDDVRAARDWLSHEQWTTLCETGFCEDTDAYASLMLFRLGA